MSSTPRGGACAKVNFKYDGNMFQLQWKRHAKRMNGIFLNGLAMFSG